MKCIYSIILVTFTTYCIKNTFKNYEKRTRLIKSTRLYPDYIYFGFFHYTPLNGYLVIIGLTLGQNPRVGPFFPGLH